GQGKISPKIARIENLSPISFLSILDGRIYSCATKCSKDWSSELLAAIAGPKVLTGFIEAPVASLYHKFKGRSSDIPSNEYVEHNSCSHRDSRQLSHLRENSIIFSHLTWVVEILDMDKIELGFIIIIIIGNGTCKVTTILTDRCLLAYFPEKNNHEKIRVSRSGISSHTGDNKHEEETNGELQNKSLTMTPRRNSDSPTHYGMENPLERKRST
ncbi:hypothetical protein TorRG33x02_232090, partial [Trema orientale]